MPKLGSKCGSCGGAGGIERVGVTEVLRIHSELSTLKCLKAVDRDGLSRGAMHETGSLHSLLDPRTRTWFFMAAQLHISAPSAMLFGHLAENMRGHVSLQRTMVHHRDPLLRFIWVQ